MNTSAYAQRVIGPHQAPQRPSSRAPSARSGRHLPPPVLARYAARTASTVQPSLEVSDPDDQSEVAADRVARQAMSTTPASTTPANPGGETRSETLTHSPPSAVATAIGSSGRQLDAETRRFMEPRFGADLGHVRVHQGDQVAQLSRDIDALAFTHGGDIFYGSGAAPGPNEVTAHEIAHVLQQTGGSPALSGGAEPTTPAARLLQRSKTGSYPIGTGAIGGFEVDLQTREGALAAPPTQSGLDGYIRFVPAPGAPNANVITMVQIVRLTDAAGTDVNPASLGAAQAPRGALGTPGKRTAEDAARGVEGGYFTDRSRQNVGGPITPAGQPLDLRYGWQPTPVGGVAQVGQTAQTAMYGGRVGGVQGETPGFKRSDDPADIRSVAIYDFPGTASPTADLNFDFETVARGEDTMFVYGGARWGFKLRHGHVNDEYLTIETGSTATFGEAIERHRDFYVHEPVTFYFDFDNASLSLAETLKIVTFLPYLNRKPDVHLSVEGFADISGGVGPYNDELSRRRAAEVRDMLIKLGVAANRIDAPVIQRGASTAATQNAGTGDQGGNAALGADQRREANRWANRRVVVTFRHQPAGAP